MASYVFEEDSNTFTGKGLCKFNPLISYTLFSIFVLTIFQWIFCILSEEHWDGWKGNFCQNCNLCNYNELSTYDLSSSEHYEGQAISNLGSINNTQCPLAICSKGNLIEDLSDATSSHQFFVGDLRNCICYRNRFQSGNLRM